MIRYLFHNICFTIELVNNILGGNKGRRYFWSLLAIIILNYIPLVFLPYVNSLGEFAPGLPLVWIYMVGWVLFSFTLLVLAYIIDKKAGE